MNKTPATLFERLAARDSVQRLLLRMGLQPRQFAVFLELFRTLSEREELVSIFGVNRFNLTYVAMYGAVMGTLFLWFPLAYRGAPARQYLLVNLLVVFVLIALAIIREAGNTLFNPTEGSVLAHTPVHSLTYATAKIAHVLIAVLYLVASLSVPAALIGVLLKGTRWFWPVTHLAAAFLTGFTTALLICALYGWMIRFVPATFLKGVSICIQLVSLVVLPYLAIFFPSFLIGLLTVRFESSQWTWLPMASFAELGLLGCRGASWQVGWQGSISIVVTAVIVWLGLRSFAGTYFSSAPAISQGRSWRNRQAGAFSRTLSTIVRATTGSPLGLGAFGFVSKMMRRDWQFRRCILTQTWLVLIAIFAICVVILRYGLPPSPLSHESLTHFMPHLLGVITMALCINICFTDFYRGSWVFLVSPIGDLRAFARGVYWALWTPAVGLPHAAVLPYLLFFWGWREAFLVAGFNMIVVSFYLALELKLVHGLPFSSPVDDSRSKLNLPHAQLCLLAAIVLPAVLQRALFHQWSVALLAGVVLAVATWVVLHLTLGGLEDELRWRLHVLRTGSAQMFKEVE